MPLCYRNWVMKMNTQDGAVIFGKKVEHLVFKMRHELKYVANFFKKLATYFS